MNKGFRVFVSLLIVLTITSAVIVSAQDPVEAEPGQEVNMVLLPKFLGILPFDQAHEGALEAHEELENPGELIFTGPTAENSVDGQIEIVTTSTTEGVDVIMLSNNAGEQIVPAAEAAGEAGIPIVTWDSPIPSGEGETIFVAQVDFGEMGRTMAVMALNLLGDDGGQLRGPGQIRRGEGTARVVGAG